MSETVDNRVVEMQFDNKNFEANVKTSLSTLEKLKQSLNFTGSTKGLENVQNAAKKIDFSGVENGITTVQNSFSALQIAGVTALATITNQAVLAGERMIKALTLTPVIDGYREYETQMNAIQTILANTQKEGTNVAIVNKYLDELNTYADKTIYNFTEMTRNIGTFTAAGVKLDTSVSSIKGIANLAAVSGSTSQQASTAMYQLSQAIASGTVKLMDWNSVVNAGMGGQVFQDALIRTSEHLQTGAKAAISAKGSFRESLSTGWLTVDVLTQTLDQFATAADTQEEYEAAVKKFVEQGYTQEEAKQMADMAKTAGEAATKVKTFTQLIDTLKEALGSGWTKTWQLIIGDFEEARSLWTSVSDVLSGIVNSVSDARNQLLESALGQSFSGLYESITGVIEPALEVADTVDEVVESVADLGTIVDDVILGKFGNGQDRFDALTEAGQNYYRVQNKVNETLGCSKRYSEEQIAAQDKLLGTQEKTTTETKKLTNAQKKQIKELAKLSDEQLRSKGYTEEQIKAFQELRDTAEKLGMPFDDFIDQLDEINGRWLLINSFKNIGKTLSATFSAISKAFSEVFDAIQPEQIFNGIAAFHKLTASMIPSAETCDKLTRIFRGLFAAIELVSTIVGGAFKVAFAVISKLLEAAGTSILDVTALVGDMVYKFNEWFQDSVFVTVVDKIVEGIQKIIDAGRDFIDQFQIDEKLAGGFESFANGLNSLYSIVKMSLPKLAWPTLINNVLKLFGTTTGDALIAISDFIVKIFEWFDANTLLIKGTAKIAEIVKTLIEGVANLAKTFMELEPVQKFIEGIADAFGKFFDRLGNIEFGTGAFDTLLNIIKAIFTKINDWLDTLGDSEHFGIDLVTGLANGIASGIGMVIESVANLATTIIETICGILGIHSPSTVMFEIGQNVIQGLINGISSILSTLWGFITGIGSGIIGTITGASSTLYDAGRNFFTSFWNGIQAVWTGIKSFLSGIGQGIADVLGKIDWGVVATVVGGAGIFFIFYSLIKVLDKFADVAKTVVSPLKSLDTVLGAFADNLKAKTLKTKADAIKSLAVAIAIVAASIWLLSTIDIGKAWNAVGIIAVITILLGGLMVALDKFTSLSAKDPKAQMINVGKLAALLISMGAALILLSASMKIISTMTWEDLGKAAAGIMGFAAIAVALIAITKHAGSALQIKTATAMIAKIGAALLIVAVAARLIAGMTWEDLGKAAAGIAGFGVLIVGLMAATRLVNKDRGIGDVGDTILKVAAAIGILAVVAKLIAGMTWEDMGKAGVGIAALAGIIVGLMAATRLLNNKRELGDVGITLLAVAAAIGILAGVAKLISTMSWGEMAKAGVGIIALGAIVAGLIAVTRYAGGNDLKGVAVTLLAMSASIAILAGICVLLGLVKTETLIKGIAAVAALSILVSMMTIATKNAKGIEKTMMAMAVAIGVMAAAIAVLSFIDLGKLAGAVAALSIVILAFAVVEKASGSVTKSFGTLIVLTAAIAVLAGALYLLASLPIESSMSAAISLSVMLLSFTAALKLMSMVGPVSKSALIGAAALVGIVALLAIILGALTALDCAPSIETAASLSLLLIALTASVGALSIIGPIASAALPGIGVMAAVVVALGALIVALGALNTYVPQLQSFLDSGIAVLQAIGEGIGAFFGGIVSGFSSAVMDLLPRLGQSLSSFAAALTPFMTTMSAMPDDLPAKVALLAGAIIALTAAELVNGITSLIPLLPDMASMGSELSAFAIALMPFIAVMNQIDDTAVAACGTLADMVLKLTAAELLDGISSFVTGKQDFSAFGEKLASLGAGISQFMTSMAGVDPAEVSTKANAVKTLCDAVSQVPTTGGLWNLIAGEKDAGVFGDQLAKLGSGVAAFMESMAGVSTEGAAEKANAVKSLCEAASQIPTTGGLWGMIAGDQDAGEFGNQLAKLGEGVASFSEATAGINAEGLEPAKQAIQACIDISGMIPEDSGIFEKIGNFFTGGDSNTSFIDKLVPLAESLKSFSEKVTGLDFSAIYNSVYGVRSLKTIGEMLSGIDIEIENDSVSFASKLIPFAARMKQYGIAVAGIDTSAIASSVSGVNAIARVGNIVSKNNIVLTAQQTMFASQLIPLAQGMKQYSIAITGIDSGSISSSVSAAKDIVSLINTTAGINIGGVSSFVSAINELGKVSFDGIIQAFSGAPAALKSIGSTLTSALASGIRTNQGVVTAAAQSVVSSTVQAVTSKTSLFTAYGLKVVTAFAKGITSASTVAKTAVMIMATSAASAASVSTASFRSAGYNCAIGFANGISSGSFRATINARAMANAAATAAKNALQINSPSKVFTKIGMGVPEGFAKGIDKYGYYVDKSISTMASDALENTKSVVSRIGDALAYTDLDSQPTIRPVVDLSNVESGASAINGLFNNDFAIGTKMNLNAISASMSRRNQNGVNDNVVSAIDKLRKDVGNLESRSYSIGGITYSAGDEVSNAIETLVRAVRVEGRV